MSSGIVGTGGRRLRLSNLDKELYPSGGFTKAHVLDYYRRIAPFMLPHLHGRALTMKRYPDGADGEFFFEKRCPQHRPDWVETADLLKGDEKMTVCLVNNPETLLWTANLASLELHVPLARASSPETPDAMVFDLDPGEPAGLLGCGRVALILRDLFDRVGLEGFVKTSGRKGLHVYVPLNRPETTFAHTRMFSKAVAELLQKRYPALVTARMAKESRTGRVFINWSQNDSSKTMICVYSLRARENPIVSCPVSWDEVENAVKREDPAALVIAQDEALNRTEKHGDLFHDLLTRKQKLPLLDAELRSYEAKRTFAKTPEPKPERRSAGGELRFVVHKHAARALHYDLRLELDGVLKSWAVPKGPSLNPAMKRLAVMVEDHPYDYKDFEGLIPEHSYGAGSVIIWDQGTYRHPAGRNGQENERLLREGLKKGDLKFILDGEKLKGEFALVKTGTDPKSWLLLKKKDGFAGSADILGENRSVVSGRTLEEIAEAAPEKSFGQKKVREIRFREALESEALRAAPAGPMPHAITPMMATPAKEPFDHEEWIFEVKWDGYRAVAEIRDGHVALYSRNQLPLNKKYPQVADALAALGHDALLDGEIVVVDEQGHPDFQMLQDYQKTGKGHLLYYVFDLLHIEGRDLTKLPLLARKELLKNILPAGARIRFSDHIPNEGVHFFKVVRGQGLEGIVAKHAQSVYQIGRRSRQWLKMKTRLTQEAVIAGFTEPKGRRKSFGTLILGVYEGKKLVHIGRSGGGFGAKLLREIRERLDPLIRPECPFAQEPASDAAVTWVQPELVCEVTFHGWTDEGLMRQPVFLRMREDKAARDVVRETPLGGRKGA